MGCHWSKINTKFQDVILRVVFMTITILENCVRRVKVHVFWC